MTKRKEWAGAVAPTGKKVTPELLAMMVDLLPSIGSLRDLCAITGLRLDTVRREVAPFLAIMKLQGTHPKCGCGKDRFHPHGCVDSYAKGSQNAVPGHRAEDHERILARRQRVLDLLLSGARFCDVDAAIGGSKGTARSYMRRFFTPADYATRQRAVERRDDNPASDPFRDQLYSRIASAVPRTMSPALREDVISEMYLAVVAGTLDEAAIKANAGRFASAAIREFESKWGPRSIDEPMFDDGSATLADRLPDVSAAEAFERLEAMTVRELKWAEAA